MKPSAASSPVPLLAVLVSAGFAAAAMIAPAPRVAHAAPGNEPRASSGALLGRLAPPFASARLAGPDPVSLEALRGRVVVLDFWATWCGPCRGIMPVLDGLHREHHPQGLSVVGLSSEPRAAIEQHLARHPVRYTVAHDTAGAARTYGVDSIPTLVVVDRGGRVREVYRGVDAARIAQLRSLVATLLAEPAP